MRKMLIQPRLDMLMTLDYTHAIDRPSSPTMDAILGAAHPVLDHGFVRVIDYMGDDAAICQAARVSYGSGTKSVSDDRGLIRYLMRHWHSTPFEMCELKLHVKLPVFVARQWIRHRTANVNEYSARYSILDREFYIPAPERVQVQSSNNKQGSGDALDAENARRVLDILKRDANQAYDNYEEMSTPADEGGLGLARELARMNLPANIYTQWYWKVDLHNLLHFLRLRADPHAQYEIRVYADEICKIVAHWVPHAFEAFEDYRLHAQQFSAQEMRFLLEKLGPVLGNFEQEYPLARDQFDMSKGEVREFLAKLGLNG